MSPTDPLHRLRRMVGRDPKEAHRTATPLELLFDLTFVAAFAQAGDEAAHLVAEGHFASAIAAFAFVSFAVCWAWVNFTWFASAFDTDDWFFRLATMVQMVGVLVVALGVGPVIADRVGGIPPWNAHHIAERYGLFVIITLGEVILGTISAVAAAVGRVGWSVEAVLIVVAGTGLAFGMWWCYFVVPVGELLARHRHRGWGWGYGGILIFAAVAAMGAGLHVAAYVAEGEAEIGVVEAVLTVAVPVVVALVAYFAIYAYLVHVFDPFHMWLLAGAVATLAAAVILAAAGASLGVCLVVAMLAPAVIVVGYETVGHQHMSAAVTRVLA